MPTIELLVLQPTPFCNIDCRYCYLPHRSSTAKMKIETVDKIFSGLFSSGWVGDKLEVLWHAGEPLVLPVEYYAEAFRLIKNLTPASTQMKHYFQTNGTLINDTWCEFFKTYNTQVGVSVDGPKEINDVNRVTRSGRSTFEQTLTGIRCLRRNDVEFSVISVLSSASLSKARELHEFYRSEGIENVCFNVEEIEGPNITSSLSGSENVVKFEHFMREFWNLTITAEGIYSIREFRQMLQNIVTPKGQTVHNTLVTPFAILNVDYEGNFTTFSPELLGQKNELYNDFIIGNFWQNKLEHSMESDVFKRLSRDVAAGVELCRTSCQYFPICGGGSPVNKLYENGTVISTETMCCRLHQQVIADLAMEIVENSSEANYDTTAVCEVAYSDLYILGAGVSFPEHLTTQTIATLKACRKICTNLPEERLISLPPELRAKCVSLWSLYQDKRRRVENYRDVTNAVLKSVEAERPVAWLTPGHPIIFDSVSEALLKAGRARGWKVSVFPAISCLDTLLAEINYDPADGLLIQDATWLVEQNIAPISSVAMLLLQPGVFGSDRAHLSEKFAGTDLTRLRDYLYQFYAPEHRCAFIRSATEAGQRHQIWWVQLRNLASVRDEVVPGSTLFLSAAEWEYSASSRLAKTKPTGLQKGSSKRSKQSANSKAKDNIVRRNSAKELDDWIQPTDRHITLCLNENSVVDRVGISTKMTRLPMGIRELHYEEGAIIPDQQWRQLKSAEARLVIAKSIPQTPGDGISIISLPPTLLEPFRELQLAASEARREEALSPLIGNAICREGTRAVIEYVKQHFQDTHIDQNLKEEPIVGGVYVRLPGLPTVTVQPDTNTLIGLHLDNWYAFPLHRRYLAPNRICINLGLEDRFFLFVNVPIAGMAKAISRSNQIKKLDSTSIARQFMISFPHYPVLRVRIRPGEAYIAPTENIMHDASSFEMSTIDVTLSLRGRFKLAWPMSLCN